MVPVLENLTSYIDGSAHTRHDYWSRWSRAPGFCFDLRTEANNSFFDSEWSNPPARIGRDARYRNAPRQGIDTGRMGNFTMSGVPAGGRFIAGRH